MHFYWIPVVDHVKRRVFETDENGKRITKQIYTKNNTIKNVPIQKKDSNGRNVYEIEYGKFLNSDEFWKQLGGKASFARLQDQYNEYITSKGFELDRGEIGANKHHQDKAEHNIKVLEDKIDKLNKDSSVHGILLQHPVPAQIDEKLAFNTILPEKDVDGFHPVNVGNLVIGKKAFLPCTPHGIIVLLERMGIDTNGKHAVVIGRSNIVGKPVSLLLARKETNCTVTMCHTGTKNMAEITKQADILVAATGRPHTVTKDMVKEGAVVIDVGVNRIPDDTKKSGFRLVGDVDFDDVKEIASYITPVPGGVGPMTIAMLMFNTLESAENTI